MEKPWKGLNPAFLEGLLTSLKALADTGFIWPGRGPTVTLLKTVKPVYLLEMSKD